MFNIDVEEIEWGGRTLRLETGRMARQADGAVLASYGETTVLATVVSDRSPRPGADFFPLTVNYQEKTYSAGKIPGGYFKREGRPTEKETLVSRLIDRPIRPLFVEGYRHETQVIATVLSYDVENEPDIVGLVAASAALTLSGIPFRGPVGAARVGIIEGEYVLNPTLEQIKASDLDLVVAGTSAAVLMVESEAKELSEEKMLGAVMFGHRNFQPVIDAIIRLAERTAREPRDFRPADNASLQAEVAKLVEADVMAAY
ncbi:MAG: polyribonucleotide nucleotidyltransferase, partial [Pseudomonadota bacterium]|nr:polyribonucleotide nucleotidyltransferase [Pseudomonadota bacterium]